MLKFKFTFSFCDYNKNRKENKENKENDEIEDEKFREIVKDIGHRKQLLSL